MPSRPLATLEFQRVNLHTRSQEQQTPHW
jgi:hypothetical protein